MKRYIIIFTVTFLTPFLIEAQYLSDAYRFSNNQIQGTARSAGMGNAMGALGGDFTSLSINPAGSGIYRTGEFVITPTFNLNNSEINLSNNKFTDNQVAINLSNIGIIGQLKVNDNNSGLVSVNYGFGFNRLSDFNSTSFVTKNSSAVSYLDDIANYSTGEKLNNAYLNKDFSNIEYRDWKAKLAWESYLMNSAVDNQGNDIDQKYVSILQENEKVDQSKSYSVEGGINEYLLNFALNFNHNFYVGTTVGIQDVNFRSISLYEEKFEQGGSFTYRDKYTVSGAGVNIKVGAIYKPVNMVRLGLAFHSPTYYQIDEESDLEMNSFLAQNYNSYGVNNYNYEFYNPSKIILSGAFIFNKVGLLSADIEYQNYSKARFRNGGDGSESFTDLNAEVDQNFKNALNLRVGGEVKFTDKFSGRLGAEFYSNPYEKSVEDDRFLTDGIMNGSIGFGYAVNNFSANFAYRHSLIKTSLSNEQPNFYQLTQKDRNGQVLMTFGFKF